MIAIAYETSRTSQRNQLVIVLFLDQQQKKIPVPPPPSTTITTAITMEHDINNNDSLPPPAIFPGARTVARVQTAAASPPQIMERPDHRHPPPHHRLACPSHRLPDTNNTSKWREGSDTQRYIELAGKAAKHR